jgi:hypothetical protein
MVQATGRSVAILGAGFSVAATNGQMPLMRTFFDQLDSKSFPELFSFVAQVAGDPAKANVEEVLVGLDQVRSAPSPMFNRWTVNMRAAEPQVQRQLAAYTIGRLRAHGPARGYNWAKDLLLNLKPETTVVSMNYDTVAERLLSNRRGLTHHSPNATCPHCRMRFLLAAACSCDGRKPLEACNWRGAFLKPHGSISWKRCLNSDCCSLQCLLADSYCRPFDPCPCSDCGKECCPVLVMPTMSKRLDDLPEITLMWEAMYEAVKEAEQILFLGFSLPMSDRLLTMQLQDALKENSSLKTVACVDLHPHEVLNRFRDFVRPRSNVAYHGFTVEPGTLQAWMCDFIKLGFTDGPSFGFPRRLVIRLQHRPRAKPSAGQHNPPTAT